MVLMQLEEEDVERIANAIVKKLHHNPAKDRLFSVEELADYLQVNPQWIYKKKGTIPHRKVGKYLKFPKSEIDRWLRENGNP